MNVRFVFNKSLSVNFRQFSSWKDLLPKDRSLKVFIVAGEPSGDYIGYQLMRHLKTKTSGNIEFAGVGGLKMRGEGLKSEFLIKNLSFMAFNESNSSFFLRFARTFVTVWRSLRITLNAVLRTKPDVIVTIDSKGFNFRLLKQIKRRLRKNRPPIVHLVGQTSVWGSKLNSHKNKVRKASKLMDHILLLFPFELPFYSKYMRATFIGFPTLEESPIVQQKLALPQKLEDKDIETLFSRRTGGLEFKKEWNIDPNATVICLLPGSRQQEMDRLFPIYKDAVKIIKEKIENIHLIVPVINDCSIEIETELIKLKNELNVPYTIAFNGYIAEDVIYRAYSASDIAIACSGSVTVELAIAGLPTIVTYSASILTETIFKTFSIVKNVSIPNIMLQSEVIPELLFSKLNSTELAEKAIQLLSDKSAQQQQITKVRSVLPTLIAKDPKTNQALAPLSIAADVVLDEFCRSKEKIKKRSWLSRLLLK